LNPYPHHYSAAFASSTILRPLYQQLSLRIACRLPIPAGWAESRGFLVPCNADASDSGAPGRLGPISPPVATRWRIPDLHGNIQPRTFWLRPTAAWASQTSRGFEWPFTLHCPCDTPLAPQPPCCWQYPSIRSHGSDATVVGVHFPQSFPPRRYRRRRFE